MEFIDQIFVNTKRMTLDILGSFLPPWVIILASILISITTLAAIGPVIMMYLTWMERKVVARIQNRVGPNRVGIFGLLQPVADGIKMLTKEDIVPTRGDKMAHLLAPCLVVIPALLAFSVLPFGRNMVAVDLNVGLLFFLAVSTISVIAIFMAAWGSHNKFSLLGGMRAIGQMISYEVPMILSVIPVILVAGTFSTVSIVEAQIESGWYVFTPWGLIGTVVFFLCGVAECNRTPFDLAEGESEIIAGFHTEYSGMKFALFYMGEFLAAFAVAAMTSTLFLGGWDGPFLPSWLWFLIKTYSFIFVMMWFRGTFPRFRIDQLMGFAWKFLLPFALLNIFVAALWHSLNGVTAWVASAIAQVIVLAFLIAINYKEAPKKRTYELVN